MISFHCNANHFLRMDPRVSIVIRLKDGENITLGAKIPEGVTVHRDGIYKDDLSLEESGDHVILAKNLFSGKLFRILCQREIQEL